MQASIDQQSTIIITMPMNFQTNFSLKLKKNQVENVPNLYFHIVLKLDGEIPEQTQKEKFQKYIGGYIRARGAETKAVGIVGDQMHLLIALPQTRALADFVREIKFVSSVFARRRLNFRCFSWQNEYEAFTVSLSQIDRIYRYIERQVRFQRQEISTCSCQPVSFRRLY